MRDPMANRPDDKSGSAMRAPSEQEVEALFAALDLGTPRQREKFLRLVQVQEESDNQDHLREQLTVRFGDSTLSSSAK
jgi:hypothetical protein